MHLISPPRPGRVFLAALLATLTTGSYARAVDQFDIHLDPGSSLLANPDALAAFERAAQEWESFIASPVRINVTADLAAIANPFVIGQTSLGPRNVNLDYTTVRDAMAARSIKPGNAILASLPTTSQISANVPPIGSFDTTTLGATTANQKALGLIASPLTDTIEDGKVVFNSNFAFDYDRTNGVDADKMDFQTVAAHEIGHVLGFLSDTDDYDFDPMLHDNATTLDLFRFNSANLPTSLAEFVAFPRELRPGEEASFFDLASEFAFSTGANYGDGNQASHWKDDIIFDPDSGVIIFGPLIGLMDPTLNFGTIESLSGADLRAMELIGYDVVPEPSGFALFAGVICSGWVGRRRQRG